jgi:hypothetical protein
MAAKPFFFILAGRFIQGIGAAGAFPIVFALVGDMFSDQDSSRGDCPVARRAKPSLNGHRKHSSIRGAEGLVVVNIRCDLLASSDLDPNPRMKSLCAYGTILRYDQMGDPHTS